jgi:hypothetical protein
MQKNGSFLDIVIAQKKAIPAPSAYNQWLAPKIKGNYTSSLDKFTITESHAHEKLAVPAPNRYTPYQDLATESKRRFPSRTYEPSTSLKKEPKSLTRAPGDKLNDKILEAIQRRSFMVDFGKEKKITLIEKAAI